MNRVLSGIKPSGSFTLGNYLGALRHWVTFQDGNDAFYCVVDLHALTEEIDPADLRANTLDAALNMLACGLEPDRCTLFIQSHVAEHTRLTWLLESTASFGELGRMTQFKDKGRRQSQVRAEFLETQAFRVEQNAQDALLRAGQVSPRDFRFERLPDPLANRTEIQL